MTFSTSLVIATYNRGPLIESTLQSVFSQDTQVSEVVVVDDGSTDGTADWVRTRFPTVRLVEKPNGGTSSARNAGAKAATGDWLIFLDHDDLLLPNAVEVLLRLADRFPEAVSLHADHVYDNRAAGVRHENHHYTLPAFRRLLGTPCVRASENARLFGDPLYRSLLRGNLLQQPFAVRKDKFLELGGYDDSIRYCEDWDLYLRLAQRYPIAVSDAVVSVHVIEGENLHLTAAQKQRVMYEKVLRKRLASHPWWQWRENGIARAKLAEQEKQIGDEAFQEGCFRRAYQSYWKAFTWLPKDYVVAARLFLRLPSLLRSDRVDG